uniref:Peptidase M28 domain-containing protein n=2 Tax=Tetranychus urticae TaxID=32264 RepID=T1JYP9_TETUR
MEKSPGILAAEHHIDRIMENLKGLHIESHIETNSFKSQFDPSVDEEDHPVLEHYSVDTNQGSNVNNLKRLLSENFSRQRNHESDPMYKDEVRATILGRMAYYTAESFVQHFEATVSLARTVKGANIIGILPGINRNQKTDSIVLIGAHYDTTKHSPGVDDNGSGIAALLEMVRILAPRSGELNNTIIFVAFDLEENGILGSLAFVNQYLIPKELKPKKTGFTGAFILDMLLNYDPNKRSQTLPSDVTRIVPKAGSFLRGNRYAGDFIALISRRDYDDGLLEPFKKAWYTMPSQSKYKLLVIDPPIPQYPHFISAYRFRNFMRSDHAAFWNHRNRDFLASLPAVLITDTGPFRGVQRACYHEFCDDKAQITTENLEFLKRIVDTLIVTVLNLAN